MIVKVVDASAAAAVLFDEAGSDEVARRMVGATLVAPALFGFELANVCVKKSKHTPNQGQDFVRAFGGRADLAVGEMGVDHDGVVDLAVATGLSAYDASYLWLSRHLGAELLTLDRRLAKVAADSPI